MVNAFNIQIAIQSVYRLYCYKSSIFNNNMEKKEKKGNKQHRQQ